MKKSYLFVFNPSLGTREEIKDFIDSCGKISSWRYELNNTYFIVSELDANDLYNLVSVHFGEGKGSFIIAEYVDNSQGLLNERSWQLLNNKKLPPKANKTRKADGF